MKTVDKAWGFESWVVNNDRYCGKLLWINGGACSSLHRHLKKHETFYVNYGHVHFEVGDAEIDGRQGTAVTVPQGTLHRFSAYTDSEIIEFSTHHEESDSYRQEPSRGAT